jgi:Kef-type K+ transport system membrane component KefB
VEIECPDVAECESSLEHALEDGSFQGGLTGVIESLSFIGYVADVSAIKVMDVSASWMEEVFTPMFGNTTVRTNMTRFITSNISGLYYQDGIKRNYVDNSSTRPSYLESCYEEPAFLTDEEMLVLPVGENWYGCSFKSASAEEDDLAEHNGSDRRLLAEQDDLADEGVRSWWPFDLMAPTPRRLSGGGSYNSYGECLTKECEAHRSSECQLYPDVFTLIGHTGVAMMIFESGMHFDFSMAKQVGPWACVVACLGTFLPLVTGMLLSMAYGFPASPQGLTAGTALAPTSVGISLRLLTEAGVLAQDFGQTIMTAAFVDDILSLVIFNIVFAIAAGDVTFMSTFFPSLMGVLFMILAVILAVTLWPWALKNFLLPGADWALRKISEPDPDNPPKISQKDQALFVIMMGMLIVYALITFLCGTHLWGCFIAGMSYACLDEEPGHAHHVWVKQTKRITSWMIRIFFSATVAFSIPVSELINPTAFLFGSIMGIGPCIATKVCCGFYMGPPKFVIGWAMVGRAEFAYLIAQMGKAGGMIDDKLFSILIWALLWATIFAPLIFRLVLTRYIKEQGIEVSTAKPAHDDHGAPINSHGHSSTRSVEVDAEAPKPVSEAVHVTESNPFVEPKFTAEASSNGGQVAVSDKQWEDNVVNVGSSKTAEELPGIPTPVKVDKVNTPEGGRGFLCCIFFKKVTMV